MCEKLPGVWISLSTSLSVSCHHTGDSGLAQAVTGHVTTVTLARMLSWSFDSLSEVRWWGRLIIFGFWKDTTLVGLGRANTLLETGAWFEWF